MDPIIRIDGVDVAIRKIDENIFVPKNTEVLKCIINGATPNFEPHDFYVNNNPPQNTKDKIHKIESFCFVATEGVKEEAAILLMSLRRFHDQPVYIVCDHNTKTFLSGKGFKNIILKTRADKDKLDLIHEKYFQKLHQKINNFHNTECIFKKMECMRIALKEHDNTFFLDSDIVVLDDIQENFTEKLVLSPHFYPREEKHKGFEFGFYNAGYLFCAEKGFPNFWKHMYLTDSIFFEQECMNRFSDHYNIQTFPEEHNVGFWRKKLNQD